MKKKANVKITPLEFFAKSVIFTKDKQDNDVKLRHFVAYSESEEDAKLFAIIFEISVKVENDMLLKVNFSGHFGCEADIDEEFKQSNFPSVNAPAIAYPYLRAFISQFLLIAGYKPIVLPAMNFVTLKEKNKK